MSILDNYNSLFVKLLLTGAKEKQNMDNIILIDFCAYWTQPKNIFGVKQGCSWSFLPKAKNLLKFLPFN